MKKRIEDNYSLSTNLNLQRRHFSDHIKTTNINKLLNKVKIEKKNDLKKKMYLFSMMSLVIILFSIIAVSI